MPLHGKSEEVHNGNLLNSKAVEVKNNLLFNSSKCEIKKSSITSYGCHFTNTGIKLESAKFQEILSKPASMNIMTLQLFLEM